MTWNTTASRASSASRAMRVGSSTGARVGKRKVDGGWRKKPLSRQEWHPLIPDAHSGYITWQDYEENLRRLQENAQLKGVEKRSAPREGPSLLQGLVICGICGSRMTVGYRQPRRAWLRSDRTQFLFEHSGPDPPKKHVRRPSPKVA